MKKDTYWDSYEGVERPHYTQVPDEVLNGLLPRLGHAEGRVLLFIVRRTFGWGKDSDNISLSQLIEGTQLHRSSVVRAVKSLEEKGVLWVRRQDSKQGGPAINTYGLVIKGGSASQALGGRRVKRLPQAHKATNKKQEVLETNDNENERPSVSSPVITDDKTALISQVHAEFAPGDTPQAIQTYLDRFPVSLITRAAEITRTSDNTHKPIAYLYGVIQRLQEQEALLPAAYQHPATIPELTAEEYQASLQALDRIKKAHVLAETTVGEIETTSD